MGGISSVSLPAVLTCVSCDCNKKCYAKRMAARRPNVKAAYQNNLDVLNSSPAEYWREVEASIMLSRYFRFHVSGDILDESYFLNMIKIAERNQHCEILCFTKKFNIINQSLANGTAIPANLHIIFSAWIGLDMDNPYNLPEAHVRYRDGTTTAIEGAVECSGNCSDCAITTTGCWTLQYNQQVVFNEH